MTGPLRRPLDRPSGGQTCQPTDRFPPIWALAIKASRMSERRVAERFPVSRLSAVARPGNDRLLVWFGQMERQLRIAIMGSGGVGGFFGAKLVKGGADVYFVARGSHLAAMREHGLAIESTDPSQSLHLPKVNVTDDPATIGPVDMVMFAVKLWDTESAARQLLPIMGPETGIISFQNGVQKDDMLRPVFGDQALMGGVAYVGTAIGRPGVIAQTGPLNRLVFGEYDGRRSKRAEAFPRRLQGRRHQRRAERRRAPFDLGEIRRAGRDVGRHHVDAPDHRADPRKPADARIPARSRPRGGRGRPRTRRQPAGGLCRAAHPVLRRLAAGDDDLDAPRPAGRPAARSALAVRRRGRSRQGGRRADADEPRGARHPAAARRRRSGGSRTDADVSPQDGQSHRTFGGVPLPLVGRG